MTPPDFDAQKIAHRGLVESTDHRAKAEIKADAYRKEQADAIRLALATGIAVPEIRRVTGLSRARIYEIRDGR